MLEKFLLRITMHLNIFFLFFFVLVFCFVCSSRVLKTSPLETWVSTKAFSSMGVYPRLCFPGAPRSWLRGTETSSQAPANSSAHIKFCLPIIRWRARQDSSWIPWHMVQDTTTPTKALLFIDGCQILFVKEETKMRDILCCQNSDVTPLWPHFK